MYFSREPLPWTASALQRTHEPLWQVRTASAQNSSSGRAAFSSQKSIKMLKWALRRRCRCREMKRKAEPRKKTRQRPKSNWGRWRKVDGNKQKKKGIFQRFSKSTPSFEWWILCRPPSVSPTSVPSRMVDPWDVRTLFTLLQYRKRGLFFFSGEVRSWRFSTIKMESPIDKAVNYLVWFFLGKNTMKLIVMPRLNRFGVPRNIFYRCRANFIHLGFCSFFNLPYSHQQPFFPALTDCQLAVKFSTAAAFIASSTGVFRVVD